MSRKNKSDEDQSVSFFKKGMIFAQQDRINDALKEFKKASKINPHYGAAWVNLGNCYFESGLYSEAIPAYEMALKCGLQEEWGAWDNLGMAYGYEGRHEDAKKAFKRALDENPMFKRSWGNLGVAHFNLREFEEAKEAFLKYIELDPDSVHARQYLRQCEDHL